MIEQSYAIEQRVSLLEQKIAQLKSHKGVMKIVESLCSAENKAIFADTKQLVHKTKRRSLEDSLELSSGNLTVDDRNELVQKMVLLFSLTDAEKKKEPLVQVRRKKPHHRNVLSTELGCRTHILRKK